MKILVDDLATTTCPTCGRDHLNGTIGAIYLRISDDREGEELGVTRQREDTFALACREDVLAAYEYSDNDVGASTRSRKIRPDFDKMIKDARTDAFSVIFAYTSNRLTRRPIETLGLIELGEHFGMSFKYVRSPSFDLSTPQGRAVAITLAAWDANESEQIADRVQRAAQQRIMSGGYQGGQRRFGWDDDGLTQRESETREIAKAAETVLDGGSLRSIARDLNARGIKTVFGKTWDALAVRAILLRPRNAGLVVYHGEIVDGVDGAYGGGIAPEAERDNPDFDVRAWWEGVWSILNDPARKTSPGNKPKWLISGIAECNHERCQDETNLMYMGGSRKGRGDDFAAFRCGKYGHNRIHAVKADEYIARAVVDRLAQPDAADLIDVREHVDTTELTRAAASIEARISEAKEAWQEGIFTLPEMKERVKRLQAQLEPITAQLTAATEIDPLVGIAGKENAREIWDEMDLDQKRELVKRLMTIRIRGAKRGRPSHGTYFDPTRIDITWKAD